jgi:hypothetical protein
MEIVGERPREVLNSLHFGSTFPRRSLITTTMRCPAGSLVSDWHVYAVEWEPGEIRFFVDEHADLQLPPLVELQPLDGGQASRPPERPTSTPGRRPSTSRSTC